MSDQKNIIIAIDGPAASGKGTLGRRLAEHYGLAYLDTGLIYRAVGFVIVEAGKNLEDVDAFIKAARNLKPEDLENSNLRRDDVSIAASVAGAIPGVRAALVDFQRTFANNPPDGKNGAVLDGRDIGTVICPTATVKFFVTATLEERAKRRFEERQKKGENITYEKVLADLKSRDARDSQRAIAPLSAASDAIELETSQMSAADAFSFAVKHVDSQAKES